MQDRDIKEQLIKHEGEEYKVYVDSEGNLSCGIGHFLSVGSYVPKAAVDAFFERDYLVAKSDYLSLMIQYSLNLNSTRQAVIINMLFNMGINRVRGFKKMLAALCAENYTLAASEMLDSKWARQVGNRAIELSGMMEEG